MAVVRTPRAVAGMTLIEVVVVLLLIGLTTALATSAFHPGQRSDLEIERLALVLETAAERARVRGTPMRFESLRHGYRFSRLDTAGNWQVVVDDPIFVEHGLPTGIALNRLSRDDQEVDDGLVFGSDIVLYTLEGVSAAGPFSLVGQASGTVKRVSASAPA